jgi:hypothetical protein
LPVDEAISRRYAAGVIVVVLHFTVIAALIAALNSHSSVWQSVREIQLLLIKPPPPPVKPRILPPLPPMAFPLLEAPEPIMPLPSAPPVSAVPASPSITSVGKALFGCDRLGGLPQEEGPQCPETQFGAPREQSVGLGPPPDPDSPWAKVIAERNTPPRPINQPCPLGSYQDTHGLPCFSFDQQAPLLGALH